MTGLVFRPSAADIRRLMEHFNVAEAQVRRDFVISWMLASIARSAPTVVFFGGTALSRTALPDLRLSEDIDLMPTQARSATARAIHEGLIIDLERGFGRIISDVPLFETKHPDASIYTIGGQSVRVQLVDTAAYQWPHREQNIDQRFNGVPEARLQTLTAAGFVAAKTAAWCERDTPRDLYDLWALATAGEINSDAGQVFRRLGPTGRLPSSAVLPTGPPTEDEWQASLAHQCRIQVTAAEAYRVVIDAWRAVAA